ncbi:hypothetical protein Ancab_035590 [Ancistrocladus abbreviatus]
MECNKDEATKAKELAEKKLEEKDIFSAKLFAQKAKSLFPELDGLPQLLAALDVYISAETKINGEVDWYGVIGVDPSADYETLRKQYHKLALILHPEKSKSVGADGAFKILSQAWSLLSDKVKRMAYDEKRNQRSTYPKVSAVNPSAPASRNGFHPPATKVNSGIRSDKGAASHFPSPSPRPLRTDTFWTACTRCRMQYEYLKVYLNQMLLCPNCREPFLAKEMPPPDAIGHQPWPSYMEQRASNHFAAQKNSPRQGGEGGSSAVNVTAGQSAHSLHSTLSKGHDRTLVHATLEDALKGRSHAFKRTHADSANCSNSAVKGEWPRKRNHVRAMNAHVTEKANQIAWGNGISHKLKLPNGSRELSLLETRNMLMEKTRMELLNKLNEWKNVAPVLKASNKEVMGKVKEKTKNAAERAQKVAVNTIPKPAAKGNGHQHGADLNTEQRDKLKVSSPVVDDDSKTAESVPVQMTVPDPDFHDFDKDRAEKSFGDNQVWAAYDDDDGMPRYYAVIHNVISRKPFKMRISWLNSKSNAEFGSINWVGSGFYKTSGDFRVGKHEINRLINSFSHKVNWTKGTRGSIRIYPMKGDVWALYKNWSPNWNELTPDDLIHKYDMVEVLEDYNEEKGVTVIPLVKVAGFKTVFEQHSDPQQVRRIPREEMFRFSHQVPSCLLTGQESPNAPVGCQELDPAATPLELLHVVSEANDHKPIVNAEKATKDDVSSAKRAQKDGIPHAKRTEAEELVGNDRTTNGARIADGRKVESDVTMTNSSGNGQ